MAGDWNHLRKKDANSLWNTNEIIVWLDQYLWFTGEDEENPEEAAWAYLNEGQSKPRSKRGTPDPVHPIYGIDDPMSLFSTKEPWNMNNFSARHSIINDLPVNVKSMIGKFFIQPVSR